MSFFFTFCSYASPSPPPSLSILNPHNSTAELPISQTDHSLSKERAPDPYVLMAIWGGNLGLYVHFHYYGPPVDLPYKPVVYDLIWDAYNAIPDSRYDPYVYDRAINRSELVFQEQGVHEGETKVVLLNTTPTNPTMTWRMFLKTVSAIHYFVRTFFYVEVDGFPGVVGTGNLSEIGLGSGVVNTS